jgi:hypothetical protein
MGDKRIPNSTQIPSYQQRKRRSMKEKTDRVILIKMNYLKMEELSYRMFPEFRKSIAFGRFPAFARLSFW